MKKYHLHLLIFVCFSCQSAWTQDRQIFENLDSIAIRTKTNLNLYEIKKDNNILYNTFLLWGNIPVRTEDVNVREKAYEQILEGYLKILNIVYNYIDEDIDVKDPPFMNVCPPTFDLGPGIVWMCGMDPEGITNLEAKEKYLKVIEENKAKNELYSFQNGLLSLKRTITISIYSCKRALLLIPNLEGLSRFNQLIDQNIEREGYAEILKQEIFVIEVDKKNYREKIKKEK